MWKVFLPIIIFHAYTVISFPNTSSENGEESESTLVKTDNFQRKNSKNTLRSIQTNKNCECGRSFLQIKIVNGKPTKVNEYTWMAALIKNGERHPFCGGSLINNQYILTAAHCIDSVKPHDFVVKLLEHDTNSEAESKVVTAKVAKILKHPEYTYYFDYDVALIRLTDPVFLTDGTSKEPKLVNVCLPTTPQYANEMWEESPAIVTGWGKVESDGSVSPILQHANLTIEKDSKCKSTFPADDITPRMMCARGLPSDSSLKVTDSCSGDSGGPLMVDINGKFIQAGIVSWGSHEGCGSQLKPGVYTRVKEVLTWITANSQDGEACRNSFKGN